MTDAMLNVAMRTAGKLAARGVFTLAEAAAFIRWSWLQACLDGNTVHYDGLAETLEDILVGYDEQVVRLIDTFALAAGIDLWCRCIKCPSCLDDERRAS